MESLYYLGIIIIAAMATAAIIGKFKLPDVTGYLLAGLIIGPSVLKLVPKGIVTDFEILSQVALSFIAYNIGAEMNYQNLKSLGSKVFIITFFEAFTAFVVVFSVTKLIGQSLPFALVLGAISSATAPAATLMVIKQYKAKGPLVDTLIPIVALDDAFCIMIFGIASTIAATILTGASMSFFHMIIIPVGKIIGAILIGAVSGIILVPIIKRFKNQGQLTSFILAVILILTHLAIKLSLSSLLLMMSFGLALCNLSPNRNQARTALDGMSTPIFIVFFTLSGADLDLKVFTTVGVLAIIYMLSRSTGKVIGARIGCNITKTDKTVSKYLGFTLLPQAGVAIGLSLIAEHLLPAPHGSQIRAIILSATVVYELLGPVITKLTLAKAGEILPENLN
ncbi:MAG: cation:proton antiporter [Tissierellia bacterium]|nr:cation:proton antiporter [Tissierellia bacterium]